MAQQQRWRDWDARGHDRWDGRRLELVELTAQTTQSDVAALFSEEALVPSKIRMIRQGSIMSGRPIKALVSFETFQQAQCAQVLALRTGCSCRLLAPPAGRSAPPAPQQDRDIILRMCFIREAHRHTADLCAAASLAPTPRPKVPIFHRDSQKHVSIEA